MANSTQGVGSALLRRPAAVVAIAMGAALAVLLRIRGSVPAPPAPGGWRDLDDATLSEGQR